MCDMSGKKGLLERLAEGVVVGDGGFVTIMEKRGYARAGIWTPEANLESPEAVIQLHREFLRAGSDVLQSFTFFASDDRLQSQGSKSGQVFKGSDINKAACDHVKKVAAEGDALVASSLTRGPAYANKEGKKKVQDDFRKQAKIFVDNGMDFLVCEFFEHVEEMEWAIEVCKEFGLPVAATMCISTEGDHNNVSAAECAVRMSKAGADLVGINCYFDCDMALATLKEMKEGLLSAGLWEKPTYLMSQPVGWHVPDAKKFGYEGLPEFPFALEPRMMTRFEAQKYARKAYELGVRYIGGCCGFEPHHIRAISEELQAERGGRVSEGSRKHDLWGAGLHMHSKAFVRKRASKDYWYNLEPATGRPRSAARAVADA